MPQVNKAVKDQRMIDMLNADAPWIFLEGERAYYDLIVVFEGNYVMRAPSAVIGKLLGWEHKKLSPRRDDLAELIGREPIMTLFRGSKIVNGRDTEKLLIRDIYEAMSQGYAWDVHPTNTKGRVRLLPDVDGISRTYRATQYGVLVVDADDTLGEATGAHIYYWHKPASLRALFEEAESRHPELWKDSEESGEQGEEEGEDEYA